MECSANYGLLALMPVLSQSLLALVRGHLVALFLLSVWHGLMKLNGLIFLVQPKGFSFAHCLDWLHGVKEK